MRNNHNVNRKKGVVETAPFLEVGSLLRDC